MNNNLWTKPRVDNAELLQTPMGARRVVICVPCRECGVDPALAARAYDAKAIEMFGEFANTNFK